MSEKKKVEQELQSEDAQTAPQEISEEVAEVAENNNHIATDEPSEEATEALLMERDQYKDALQRERADFINYKKRVERERADMRTVIEADVIAKFLPIIDDFDRAMAAVPSNLSEEEQSWLTGFSMIHKKFKDLLAQMGVEVIDPIGQPFDPNYHEAVSSEDSDEYESNTVTEVLQKGYKLNDRCIRVAMVKVAN
ncbi:MAG: nucleotide exchange factor GrpE [Phototrophicales bacterium]|nr:MAG: nucleotide exchange factor GrpE [Phototrophicales bacterium]